MVLCTSALKAMLQGNSRSVVLNLFYISAQFQRCQKFGGTLLINITMYQSSNCFYTSQTSYHIPFAQHLQLTKDRSKIFAFTICERVWFYIKYREISIKNNNSYIYFTLSSDRVIIKRAIMKKILANEIDNFTLKWCKIKNSIQV